MARRLALGAVGDDHRLSRGAVRDLPPLAPDGKARATAAQQATGLDLLDQVRARVPDRQPTEPGQVLVEPLRAAVERRTGQQPVDGSEFEQTVRPDAVGLEVTF